MNSQIKHLLIAPIVFTAGFLTRGFFPVFINANIPTNDKLPVSYGCTAIARWHQDYLSREYGVDFYTNANNPNINEKASELNQKLLEICNTDPTK